MEWGTLMGVAQCGSAAMRDEVGGLAAEAGVVGGQAGAAA